MKTLLGLLVFTFAGASQASQFTVKGTWGTQTIHWQITEHNNEQLWTLKTDDSTKVLQVLSPSPDETTVVSADAKSNLHIVHSENKTEMLGQLDGKAVELSVEHTNNGTLWFSGVFKNHRPSLRIDLPTESRAGRATGFFKNELADLYIVSLEGGYHFKGYMNGYWIDLLIKKEGRQYILEGSYLSKRMSLRVAGDSGINDLIEYLLLDTPIPNSDFLNLSKEGF